MYFLPRCAALSCLLLLCCYRVVGCGMVRVRRDELSCPLVLSFYMYLSYLFFFFSFLLPLPLPSLPLLIPPPIGECLYFNPRCDSSWWV